MHIWVDADACPVALRDLLFRAAERTRTPTTLVANAYLRLPPSAWINSIQVEQGFDVADRYIISKIQSGDLVITQDVPLAAQAIDRGAKALNHRGELLTSTNIGDRLATRNLLQDLRDAGLAQSSQNALSLRDRQLFASELERQLRPSS
ncbi:MAG: YaiI/YqxD family protein [Pseudomonadales bacterium]|nr:YaiI/YqxD family protein [Pseudomonadales bacterium]